MSERIASIPPGKTLVLFDGYCNLCNGAVQFILKRDPKGKFLFAALTWPVGVEVAKSFTVPAEVDSIMVYHKGRLYTHSSAALIIASRLGALWPLTGIFWIVPPFIRNAVYKWVARNRYSWFGRKETCMIPDYDVSSRFMTD